MTDVRIYLRKKLESHKNVPETDRHESVKREKQIKNMVLGEVFL